MRYDRAMPAQPLPCHFPALLLSLLLAAAVVGCTRTPPPPPNAAGVPVVDRELVERAVRHYLRWERDARSIDKLSIRYAKPEKGDGKATDLVVYVRYAIASREARRPQTLSWGEERLRLQTTDRGYRVLR